MSNKKPRSLSHHCLFYLVVNGDEVVAGAAVGQRQRQTDDSFTRPPDSSSCSLTVAMETHSLKAGHLEHGPVDGLVCPGYLWQKSSNAIMVASEPRLLEGVVTGTDQ